MKSLDIGVDLDGVAYPFTEALRHYLIEHEGFEPSSVEGGGHDAEESCWDFYKKYWNMSTKDFLKYSDEGVDAGVVFLHGDPFPGTVETLNSLKDKGHRIHIITNRSFGKRSHHNTSDWLFQHEIPYDSLSFSPSKTLFRTDIFVDDYEMNFKELWEVGIECWLYDRPWNKHVDDNGYRVYSWKDFEEAVDRKASE